MRISYTEKDTKQIPMKNKWKNLKNLKEKKLFFLVKNLFISPFLMNEPRTGCSGSNKARSREAEHSQMAQDKTRHFSLPETEKNKT